MIYLKPEVLAKLDGTLAGLKHALQQAIELEHSTIPPYLYALYSLEPGHNVEIGALIRSIVLQEMLHMALDCNVMNAVGGSPNIDHPRFIPKYPGPLPGSVESGLIVPLSPFTKQLVHDVFMVIEEPETPLHFPVLKMTAAEPVITIGEFYAEIKRQIVDLSKGGNNIFTGDRSKQLTTGFTALQTMEVTGVDSALAAIDLIVEQGEGTKTSPLDPEHQLAHYYKYAEIFHGRKLVPVPDPKPGEPDFAYAGPRIPFDPNGVFPAPLNPHAPDYPPGSKARNLDDTFNYTYTNLLRALHLVFNGQPDRLGPAFTLMESMREQARLLMSFELAPGRTAGPSFQYHPLKPANSENIGRS
jgi:hypothetical protein